MMTTVGTSKMWSYKWACLSIEYGIVKKKKTITNLCLSEPGLYRGVV